VSTTSRVRYASRGFGDDHVLPLKIFGIAARCLDKEFRFDSHTARTDLAVDG